MREEVVTSVDRFADIQVLSYSVPGFEELSLRQKQLVYYLSEAALWGRDILFDQNGSSNLPIRRLLESVYIYATIDRTTPDFREFEVYLKRVWFSNGIHHHYSSDKFLPGFTPGYLRRCVDTVPAGRLPLEGDETPDEMCRRLFPIIFDASLLPKRVNQEDGADLVLTSAANYYCGVTQREAEVFYAGLKAAGSADEPPMYGLNSRLVKEDGTVKEQVWKIGGMYTAALEKIVYWLEKAETVAESDEQRRVIRLLVEFYRTGDLKVFDAYSIAWLKDTASQVDFVNGFIETYGDPLGLKASWESIVNFKDLKATRRTETISRHAQWFEDHSPVDSRFKKPHVKGVSAKVITAAILGGDLYPSTAIGINLPNSNWIRSVHGSKSVTIGNLTAAYNRAAKGSGFREAFIDDPDELDRIDRYADITDDLHTDLHECLGHGSGQLLPGMNPDALKAYGATIEEARADLFGLYYLPDEELVALGLTPDGEAYKAAYYTYMMNGLMTQLVRIQPGCQIEEAHMRNRQLIARWALEQGRGENIVELDCREGKTYVRIHDYPGLRKLFGRLLAEVQRIKSEGDYEAARRLVEDYGVKVDPRLHAEVLERYRALQLAPYKGFVNPRYEPVYDERRQLVDVRLCHGESFAGQMLRYSRDYSAL